LKWLDSPSKLNYGHSYLNGLEIKIICCFLIPKLHAVNSGNAEFSLAQIRENMSKIIESSFYNFSQTAKIIAFKKFNLP
jgi:hypothetical protein